MTGLAWTHRGATHHAAPRRVNRSQIPLCSGLVILASLLGGLASLFSGSRTAHAQPVLSPPSVHLGRAIGSDGQLADWNQVSSYFDNLAASSDRARLREVGPTTEGKRFIIVEISSRENLERIDELKGINRQLLDARGQSEEQRDALEAHGKVFCFVSCQMHSTEVAATEMSMQLAYQLVTSQEQPWVTIRDNMVVVLAPCLNPDGLDHVSHWYRRIVDTPFEGAALPELYQRYAGHDNNRDWFMLSLQESRLVTQLLYHDYFPQIYWDVHQQGRNGERLFVPPFRDPLNPNCDPGIVSALGALGSRAVMDMTQEGLQGVATGVRYDMWWNGGNRSVPVRHNMVGVLTEAASCYYATPIFLRPDQLQAPRGIETGYAPSNRFVDPWPGGWWRIGDIVRYELAFARSFLGSLAREPKTWLHTTRVAAERTLREGERGVRGWIIPHDVADSGALRRMVESLLLGGVELERLTQPWEFNGRRHEPGALLLRRAQPFGRYLTDLFEAQCYPDGPAPYDVAGWTLPYLFGIPISEIREAMPEETETVLTAEQAIAQLSRVASNERYRDDFLLPQDTQSYIAAFGILHAGISLGYALPAAEGVAGGLVLPSEGAYAKRRSAAWIESTAAPMVQGLGATAVPTLKLPSLPRLAVYAPWRSNIDEGWLRWMLDYFQYPYQRLRNETIKEGRLRDLFDVIVIPSISEAELREGRSSGSVFEELTGGWEAQGVVALREFVREGGNLIALENSCKAAIELFDMPVTDVTRTKVESDEKPFSCPGSVLTAELDSHSLWGAGLSVTQNIMFSRGLAFAVTDPAWEHDVLLRFPSSSPLLSGWIQSPQRVARAALWLRRDEGLGQIHLFGYRPHYRSWSHASFKLLLRAILLPRSTP